MVYDNIMINNYMLSKQKICISIVKFLLCKLLPLHNFMILTNNSNRREKFMKHSTFCTINIFPLFGESLSEKQKKLRLKVCVNKDLC